MKEAQWGMAREQRGPARKKSAMAGEDSGWAEEQGLAAQRWGMRVAAERGRAHAVARKPACFFTSFVKVGFRAADSFTAKDTLFYKVPAGPSRISLQKIRSFTTCGGLAHPSGANGGAGRRREMCCV